MFKTKTKCFILGFSLIFGIVFVFSYIRASNNPVTKAEEVLIQDFKEPRLNVGQGFFSLQNYSSENIILDKENGGFKPQKTYLSPILTSNIVFNAVGPHWIENLPDETEVDLEIRIGDLRDNWSDWFPIERSEKGREGDNSKETFGELIFTEKGKQVQYKVILKTKNSNVSPKIEQIKFTYIDSTQNSWTGKISGLLKKIRLRTSQAAAMPRIISRAEWGADENLRHWNPEYTQIYSAIIHHTASSDGGNDPAATIRSIYYYHSITRGWGDIGYNFLIDKNGNIYEGRYGGDGVIAGHAYGYNRGSIGISFLGTFDDIDATYSAKKAAADLIASKFFDFGLMPKDKGFLVDKWIDNISGHRDVGFTNCPGDKLYKSLSQIRELAQQRIVTFGDRIYKGEVVKKIGNPLSLEKHKTGWIDVEIKNLSNITWHNYTWDPVRIGTTEPRDRASDFVNSSWFCENRPAVMKESNVAPGEIAHFKLLIKGSRGGDFQESFQAVYDGRGWILGTDFIVSISVADPIAYQAQLVRIEAPLAVLTGQLFRVKFVLKNIGTENWTNNTYPQTQYAGFIALNKNNPKGGKSEFWHPSWPRFFRPGVLEQQMVKPGEEGTISAIFKAPDKPGIYYSYFRPVVEFVQWFSSKDIVLMTRVDAPFKGELIYSNIPKALKIGQEAVVTALFKNTGIESWHNWGNHPIVLEASKDDYGLRNKFYHYSWLELFRPAKIRESKVLPGGIATVVFKIKAPQQPGLYYGSFVLMAKDLCSVGESSYDFLIRIDP